MPMKYYLREKDDAFVCKGCGYSVDSLQSIIRHAQQCESAHGILKRIINSRSRKFMKNKGWDLKRKEAQIFEYIYERDVWDIITIVVSILVILIRCIGWISIEYVPYSGTIEGPGIPYEWVPEEYQYEGCNSYDGSIDALFIFFVSVIVIRTKVLSHWEFKVIVRDGFVELFS